MSLIRVSHQNSISPEWYFLRVSFIKVVSHQTGQSSGWLTRMISHQDGISSDCLSSGCLSQNGISSGWYLFRVSLIRVFLTRVSQSEWYLIGMVSPQGVSHQGGLSSGCLNQNGISSGCSLIRVIFHMGGLSLG